MVKFTTVVLKFEKQGEKTGWTYIEVPADIAQRIKSKYKKSFRVKGRLDNYAFKGTALLPMGGGSFIMPLNAGVRKAIGKRHGAMLSVQMEEDTTPVKLHAVLMECLGDEPGAMKFFNQLPLSHRNYFSKWIESAKTEATQEKRIAQAVTALAKGWGFPEMLRSQKANRNG